MTQDIQKDNKILTEIAKYQVTPGVEIVYAGFFEDIDSRFILIVTVDREARESYLSLGRIWE